jgi:hypothetical protein
VVVEAHDDLDGHKNMFAAVHGGMDAHVVLLLFFIGSYSISRDVYRPTFLKI